MMNLMRFSRSSSETLASRVIISDSPRTVVKYSNLKILFLDPLFFGIVVKICLNVEFIFQYEITHLIFFY